MASLVEGKHIKDKMHQHTLQIDKETILRKLIEIIEKEKRWRGIYRKRDTETHSTPLKPIYSNYMKHLHMRTRNPAHYAQKTSKPSSQSKKLVNLRLVRTINRCFYGNLYICSSSILDISPTEVDPTDSLAMPPSSACMMVE